ncbi:(4Fe-4S)-binding protein [Belliella sp. R4-6]|uniref:(4Fe-4S)-binding protein n=1 Tax=Belliella alkalica TaxID=1730871 RepID=A0ABS9VE21_9BACT|nr:(4Fe-4S)-binding protein [Belliella alkalica]MCH7414677.1 (4Fe-4S)-binding protein [Belliella alkalica]
MKEYSNGEVTITWEPEKCVHSGVCVKGLGEVFQPKEKPWIKIDAASSEKLVNQVKKCPSEALGYYLNNEDKEIESSTNEQIVEVIPNGPLMVYGNIEVKFKDGHTERKSKSSAFCRCGSSQNKPFCDGAHKKIGFEG